jgi:hypothetical protein
MRKYTVHCPNDKIIVEAYDLNVCAEGNQLFYNFLTGEEPAATVAVVPWEKVTHVTSEEIEE